MLINEGINQQVVSKINGLSRLQVTRITELRGYDQSEVM